MIDSASDEIQYSRSPSRSDQYQNQSQSNELESSSLSSKVVASNPINHLEWLDEEDLSQEWIPETVRSQSDIASPAKSSPTLQVEFNHHNHINPPKRRTKHSRHISISRSNSQLEIANSGLFESSKAPPLPSIASPGLLSSPFPQHPKHLETFNHTPAFDPHNTNNDSSNVEGIVTESPSAAGTVNIRTSIYPSSPQPDTPLYTHSDVDASSTVSHTNEQQDGTTRHYHNDTVGSVIKHQPSVNKLNDNHRKIQTPQWKRALRKSQNNAQEDDIHQNQEHSFQKLFNPPTINLNNPSNEPGAYTNFTALGFLSEEEGVEKEQAQNGSGMHQSRDASTSIAEHSQDETSILRQNGFHQQSNGPQSNYFRQHQQFPNQYLGAVNGAEKAPSPQLQHITDNSIIPTATGISTASVTSLTPGAFRKTGLFGDHLKNSNISRASSSTNINTKAALPSPSPLKLFSHHDTYTNNRLDNLIGSLEDGEDDDENESYGQRTRDDLYSNHSGYPESQDNRITLRSEEDNKSYIISQSSPRSQVSSEDQYIYSGSYTTEDDEAYEDSNNYEVYPPNNTDSKLATGRSDSVDKFDMTTQEFMTNADNVMSKLRVDYQSSMIPAHGFDQSQDDSEYENGEYTATDESSAFSEAGHREIQHNHLESIHSGGNYVSEIDTNDVTQNSIVFTDDSNEEMMGQDHPMTHIHTSTEYSGKHYLPGTVQRQQRLDMTGTDDDGQSVSTIKPSGSNHLRVLKQGDTIYEEDSNHQPRHVSSTSDHTNQSSLTSQLALQSPEKPGRRNMGVILGTDEVAKKIPKTMGAMHFDSKNKVWYKVDMHGKHIHHNRSGQIIGSGSHSAKHDTPNKVNKSYHNDRSIHVKPFGLIKSSSDQNKLHSSLLPNKAKTKKLKTKKRNIFDKTNSSQTGASTNTTPFLDSFTFDDTDAFSEFDDSKSHAGSNFHSGLKSDRDSDFENADPSENIPKSKPQQTKLRSNRMYGSIKGSAKRYGIDRESHLKSRVSQLSFNRHGRNASIRARRFPERAASNYRKFSKKNFVELRQSSSLVQSKIPVLSRRPLPKTPVKFHDVSHGTSPSTAKIPRTHKPNPNHLLPATPKAQFTREARRHISRFVTNPVLLTAEPLAQQSSSAKYALHRVISRPRSNPSRELAHQEFANFEPSELSRISEMQTEISQIDQQSGSASTSTRPAKSQSDLGLFRPANSEMSRESRTSGFSRYSRASEASHSSLDHHMDTIARSSYSSKPAQGFDRNIHGPTDSPSESILDRQSIHSAITNNGHYHDGYDQSHSRRQTDSQYHRSSRHESRAVDDDISIFTENRDSKREITGDRRVSIADTTFGKAFEEVMTQNFSEFQNGFESDSKSLYHSGKHRGNKQHRYIQNVGFGNNYTPKRFENLNYNRKSTKKVFFGSNSPNTDGQYEYEYDYEISSQVDDSMLINDEEYQISGQVDDSMLSNDERENEEAESVGYGHTPHYIPNRDSDHQNFGNPKYIETPLQIKPRKRRPASKQYVSESDKITRFSLLAKSGNSKGIKQANTESDDELSRSIARMSVLSDLSYQHNKSCLVHALTDRYGGEALSSSKVLSRSLYKDDNNGSQNNGLGGRYRMGADRLDISPSRSITSHSIHPSNSSMAWCMLTDINLSRANLESLIDLGAVCPKLVRLDVSHNKLSSVLGISSSIRVLNISHNNLTNISTVGGFKSLANLHVLNISFNKKITSLVGVSHLVNLRELRAGDCGINSFSIVENSQKSNIYNTGFAKELDALSVVDLQNNRLEGIIDFKHDCNFGPGSQLESLKLRGNKIEQIWNLSIFNRLKSLDVGMFLLKIFFFFLFFILVLITC